jgi:hypothetical protein
MLQLENDKGVSSSSSEDAATTLHPCWDAYHLADEYDYNFPTLIYAALVISSSLFYSSSYASQILDIFGIL